MDEKLFLIACIHASNADYRSLSKIYGNFQGSREFINAIIVLWPELDDPLHLQFLFEPTKSEGDFESEADMIVSQIAAHPNILFMIEMGDDVVHQRYNEIQQYIDLKLSSLKVWDSSLDWFQQRVVLCDEIDSSHTLAYEPLWERIKGQDEVIDQWFEGIVKPVAHYNQRLHTTTKIRDFTILMADKTNFSDWFDSSATNDEVLKDELMPFLKYREEAYKMFLHEYYNSETFKLNSLGQYNRLQLLFKSFLSEFSEDKLEIETRTLDILFENTSNLMSFINLSQLKTDFLTQIDSDTVLEKYQITNSDIISYCEVIEQYSSVTNYSLLDLYGITQEDKAAQWSHFTSLCERMINSNGSQIDLEQLLTPIPIFNKIQSDQEEDRNKIIMIILETVIHLEKFILIEHVFALTENKASLLNVLVNTFWQYFHNSMGMNTIEMSNAETLLKYVKQYDREGKTSHRLSQLVSLCHDLYLSPQWKFQRSSGTNNKKQQRSIPSHILEFHKSPLEIIRILMELNPTFYRQNVRQVTWPLWEKILVSLQCMERETDYMDLLALHIDYSLVYNDFEYAVGHVDKLLNEDDSVSGERHWLTIFQVCKYSTISSSGDSNVDLDTVSLQMNILSRLLRVCPESEVEIVTNQWTILSKQISGIDPTNNIYGHGSHGNSKNGSISRLLTGFV